MHQRLILPFSSVGTRGGSLAFTPTCVLSYRFLSSTPSCISSSNFPHDERHLACK